MSRPRMYTVSFIPRGTKRPVQVLVGFRAAELLVALRDRQASRFEMLQIGRPRIGLNAPSVVSTLINKGFSFAKHRVDSDDEHGNRTWWFRYELLDKIVSIDPVVSKREAAAA